MRVPARWAAGLVGKAGRGPEFPAGRRFFVRVDDQREGLVRREGLKGQGKAWGRSSSQDRSRVLDPPSVEAKGLNAA